MSRHESTLLAYLAAEVRDSGDFDAEGRMVLDVADSEAARLLLASLLAEGPLPAGWSVLVVYQPEAVAS